MKLVLRILFFVCSFSFGFLCLVHEARANNPKNKEAYRCAEWSCFIAQIQSNHLQCGTLDILVQSLQQSELLTKKNKSELIQAALDFYNCCPVVKTYSNKWEKGFIKSCELQEKINKSGFINEIHSTDFLLNCPDLTAFINNLDYHPDSRLGTYLIIQAAAEQGCDYTKLQKIKNNWESNLKKLWAERYNIHFSEFIPLTQL